MEKQQVDKFQLGPCILLCDLRNGHFVVATPTGSTLLDRKVPVHRADLVELMVSPSDALIINVRGESKKGASTHHLETHEHGQVFPGTGWRDLKQVR